MVARANQNHHMTTKKTKARMSRPPRKGAKPYGGRKTTDPVRGLSRTMSNMNVSQAPGASRYAHQVCGLSDPFCDAALGAKFPDNAGIRTLPYPRHNRYTITTDANGNGTALFIPNYDYQLFTTGTVNLGATACTFATMTAQPTMTGSDQYRINTAGFRVKRITAPLSSSGMVYIRGFSSHNGSSLTTINPSSYFCDFSSDIALQDCRDVMVLAKRTDIRSKQYHRNTTTTPTINVADWVSPGWGCILVTVVGGPVSVVALELEVRANYEITFQDNESNQILATPSPASNGVVEGVVDLISSEAKTVFLSGAREASSWVASQATKSLGEMLRARVGRQALALAL